MVREVVRDLRRRKPDIASLAYFDAALADRHAKRTETPSERAGYAAVTDFDAEFRCSFEPAFGRDMPGLSRACVARRTKSSRDTGSTQRPV